MRYKSDTQPLCRCCGKPIAKSTRIVWLRRPSSTGPSNSDFSRTMEVDSFPTSREECQRLTNWQVTALSYWKSEEGEARHVTSFHEWDGESWKDEFFCTGTCAEAFARMCARHQTGERPLVRLWTQAYSDAVARRNQ